MTEDKVITINDTMEMVDTVQETPTLTYAKWFIEMAQHPDRLNQMYGICTNFKDTFNEYLGEVMRKHSISYRNWPHYSGDIVYPVPASDDFDGNERNIYMYIKLMYDEETEYGQTRIDLLHWLSEQFTAAELNN